MNTSTVIYTFDGSREGFFSVVFRAFKDQCTPLAIISRNKEQQMPLGELIHVVTSRDHASRVAKGIRERSGKRGARLVDLAFQADRPETPLVLWRYLYKLFKDTTGNFHGNMLDEDVCSVTQLARKVKGEVHRFHGLVRFRQTSGRLLVAAIEPDHDIVMMLAPHFRSRMALQEWVIYDMRRGCGVYYDTKTIRMVRFSAEDPDQPSALRLPGLDVNCGFMRSPGNAELNISDRKNREDAGDEDLYQVLWQHYYNAINIRERNNHRQMRSAMPKRYWKYLPEKEGKG